MARRHGRGASFQCRNFAHGGGEVKTGPHSRCSRDWRLASGGGVTLCAGGAETGGGLGLLSYAEVLHPRSSSSG